MKIPARLEPLLDVGIIDDVVRPLMSGKEAAVYLVESRGDLRVAKVYKDAQKRSFKHRSDYTEGRKVRNSRRQRAMEKRSRYGREEMEAEWRTAEVDAIRRLRTAGVLVPEPFEFFEGVLVMELIEGDPGLPAPRLVDVSLTPKEARSLHRVLLIEIVKMLCAGVVHGDLSDFNVLLRDNGPVIIDFPQAVDPSFNNNAKKLFIRDVDNISSFLARFAPELGRKRYGKEIWQLYERGELDPEVELTGSFTESSRSANVGAILDEIDAARDEAMRKRGERPERPPERAPDRPWGRRGEPPPTPVELASEGMPRRRSVVVPSAPARKPQNKKKGRRGTDPRRQGKASEGSRRRHRQRDGSGSGPPRGDAPSGGGRRQGGRSHSDGARGDRDARAQGVARGSSAPPGPTRSHPGDDRPPASGEGPPRRKRRRRRRRRRGGPDRSTPSGGST